MVAKLSDIWGVEFPMPVSGATTDYVQTPQWLLMAVLITVCLVNEKDRDSMASEINLYSVLAISLIRISNISDWIYELLLRRIRLSEWQITR